MRIVRLLVLVGASCLGAASCGSPPEKSDMDFKPVEMTAQRISQIQADGRLREEAWRIDLSGLAEEPTQDRMIQVEGRDLYVQDDRHVVHAIDRAAGVHRWVVGCSGPLSQLISLGGMDCVLVSEDQMLAVNRNSGARSIGANILNLDGWPACNGTEAGGVLFVGMEAPMGVRAVHSTSGQSGWLYGTRGRPSQLISYTSGSINNVLCVTEDGLLVALPPNPVGGVAPGSELWFRRIPGTRVGTPLAVDGDLAYFGCENGFVYCMKLTTGDVRWRAAAETSFEHGPMPLSAGGRLFVGTGSRMFVLDAGSGEIQWQCDAERAVTVIGELCYLQQGSMVEVRRTSDGAQVAGFDASGLNLPAVPGGGVLIIGDGQGHLFGLR